MSRLDQSYIYISAETPSPHLIYFILHLHCILTHSARSQTTPSTPPPFRAVSGETAETVEMTTVLSKHADNIIPTPAGNVHVRPYRSSSNAQLKAILSFTPRVSSLDRENIKSQSDEFRGFFTLFWIGKSPLTSLCSSPVSCIPSPPPFLPKPCTFS